MELEWENEYDIDGSKLLTLSITHKPDRSYLIEVFFLLLTVQNVYFNRQYICHTFIIPQMRIAFAYLFSFPVILFMKCDTGKRKWSS